MFDRVVPDFAPSEAALATSLATLQRLVDRVARAIDAGGLAPGDPFTVACGLWALEHGLVSLAARTAPEPGHTHEDGPPFDWTAASAVSIRALLAGLRAAP